MWSTSAGGHLMMVVNLTGFTVLCFIKTQPFVKQKPVKTEKKSTETIAFRFRQVYDDFTYRKTEGLVRNSRFSLVLKRQ
jgi:hypothetical protein